MFSVMNHSPHFGQRQRGLSFFRIGVVIPNSVDGLPRAATTLMGLLPRLPSPPKGFRRIVFVVRHALQELES